MYSRWVNTAVVLLWLSAMSWLVIQKVLPPLLVGDPPNYRTILEARQDEPPVGWEISLDDRALGWAISSTTEMPGESVQISSKVHFDRLPVHALLPGWIGTAIQLSDSELGELRMDAESTLTVDMLGHLVAFESILRSDPGVPVIKMQGTADGAKLKLVIRFGNDIYEDSVDLPRGVMLGDAMSPQTLLPDLQMGQSWKLETYSPGLPTFKTERLKATVEDIHRINYNGHQIATWVVVCRGETGFRLIGKTPPRGRLWVCREERVLADGSHVKAGTVLRQEMTIFGAKMTFQRIAGKRVAALEQQWDRERVAFARATAQQP